MEDNLEKLVETQIPLRKALAMGDKGVAETKRQTGRKNGSEGGGSRKRKTQGSY
jgi:hypothetical protein